MVTIKGREWALVFIFETQLFPFCLSEGDICVCVSVCECVYVSVSVCMCVGVRKTEGERDGCSSFFLHSLLADETFQVSWLLWRQRKLLSFASGSMSVCMRACVCVCVCARVYSSVSNLIVLCLSQ